MLYLESKFPLFISLVDLRLSYAGSLLEAQMVPYAMAQAVDIKRSTTKFEVLSTLMPMAFTKQYPTLSSSKLLLDASVLWAL